MYQDHPPPHVHAVKDKRSAMINIRTLKVVRTSLTNKQAKRALDWIEDHEEALLDAWDILQAGGTPARLDR
jgi:hypothetical protein